MDVIISMLRNERDHYPSESAMARAFGIPQQTMNDILSGNSGIGTKTLVKILGIRPEWVLLLNDRTADLGPSPRASMSPGGPNTTVD